MISSPTWKACRIPRPKQRNRPFAEEGCRVAAWDVSDADEIAAALQPLTRAELVHDLLAQLQNENPKAIASLCDMVSRSASDTTG